MHWGARILFIIWTSGAIFWLWFALQQPPMTLQQPDFSWFWVLVALLWTLMPLLFAGALSPSARYMWLLWSIILCMLLLQMTYWIGSQRYSTRYYYEALTAAAVLSALPLAYLLRFVPRLLLYSVLTLVLVVSLFSYSLPRVQVLYRFNFIGQDILDEIEIRREGEKPVLILINGTDSGDNRVRWRALGTLMAVTSPFFDSDIVAAWDYGADGVRDQILARFPDRQIIEMDAVGNEAMFR
jgi:FlaA1/EpsC-like NDP-sugar epimerase